MHRRQDRYFLGSNHRSVRWTLLAAAILESSRVILLLQRRPDYSHSGLTSVLVASRLQVVPELLLLLHRWQPENVVLLSGLRRESGLFSSGLLVEEAVRVESAVPDDGRLSGWDARAEQLHQLVQSDESRIFQLLLSAQILGELQLCSRKPLISYLLDRIGSTT